MRDERSGAAIPPALLHAGRVSHVRHVAPKTHFSYRVWMASFDLDRLDEVVAGSRIFRRNRAGLVSLHERDHGPRDGGPLRPFVAAALERAGLGTFAARIHFLVTPRQFGYAFNPIAFFFCHDAQGRLGAVLHQVKNTFGDQIVYLAPIAAAGDGPPRQTLRQQAAKRMHVSPFFDREGGYRFAFRAPDFADARGNFSLALRYGTPAEARLTATLRLAAEPFGDGALVRLLAGMPLAGLQTIAAIHWEALGLWRRGARFHREPERTHEPVSVTRFGAGGRA